MKKSKAEKARVARGLILTRGCSNCARILAKRFSERRGAPREKVAFVGAPRKAPPRRQKTSSEVPSGIPTSRAPTDATFDPRGRTYPPVKLSRPLSRTLSRVTRLPARAAPRTRAFPRRKRWRPPPSAGRWRWWARASRASPPPTSCTATAATSPSSRLATRMADTPSPSIPRPAPSTWASRYAEDGTSRGPNQIPQPSTLDARRDAFDPVSSCRRA